MRRAFSRRRVVLLGSAAALAGCAATDQGNGDPNDQVTQFSTLRDFSGEPFPVRRINRDRFDRAFSPVILPSPYASPAGSLVIDTATRQLYLIEGGGLARRYGVAVGDAGYAWSGEAYVGRKAEWPAWHPTPSMHAEAEPPVRVDPGDHNPLGARALYLHQGGRDTLYRIHGTSEPWTIGTRASSGCIRMFNEDVIDLYDRVRLNARVIVL